MSGTAERSGVRAWTLRQRVGRASAALLVLLAALFAIVLVSLIDFKSKGDEVIDRWQPAFTLSQNLLADLVNQETGIRGYALGQEDVFLQPYKDYLVLERAQEKTLAGYLSGHPDLQADFRRFEAAAENWRTTVAEPFIARAQRGDASVGAAATAASAKAAFDRIRTASADLTADIRTTREQAKSDRITAATYVWVAVSVTAALILAAFFLIWRGLRTSVLGPIEELAAQTREVARGEIDRTIVEGGPPEIAGLGHDVDTMRARIASELARVERARVVVLERSAELARSNADLEQFAYVASHDLSEPLRKVANFCQLLERQYGPQLDDKARQYIDFAVDGAKRMQVLIADLLSFSRVGRTTDRFEPVDVGAAVDRALAVLEDRVASSGAQIVRGPLPVLDGDRTLIAALFQNLIGNALKYSDPSRPPRIELSAVRDDDTATWTFTVSDNGIGIDRQYAERIFTIFQRLHLRDQYGGTGIGLALCRKIVEFHRGRIWLGDNDGPGATFLLTLPEHADARLDADEY